MYRYESWLTVFHLKVSHLENNSNAFFQALSYTKNLLKKITGSNDLTSGSERSRNVDGSTADTGSSSAGSLYLDELSDLLGQADTWLARAELLQSLLGSGIIASLDDIADKESSASLRDRLVSDEWYSMAVYTCKKCKVHNHTSCFCFMRYVR
jgi:zinc finger FYVE domain-containing protein 26